MRSGKQNKRWWIGWVHRHESKQRASRVVRHAVRRTLRTSTTAELDAVVFPEQRGGYHDADCETTGTRGRTVRLIPDHDYWFYYGLDPEDQLIWSEFDTDPAPEFDHWLYDTRDDDSEYGCDPGACSRCSEQEPGYAGFGCPGNPKDHGCRCTCDPREWLSASDADHYERIHSL